MHQKKITDPTVYFSKYFPPGAVPYAMELWKKYHFYFKINKRRTSKFGDYRYEYTSGKHTITVNADLNPYAFLITYLHEVAHLVVNIKYGTKVMPHGEEWKKIFREISKPVLHESIFPKQLLDKLKKHLENPTASSCSDQALFTVISSYDKSNGQPILDDIQPGLTFQLQNRLFVKGEKRRSRTVCTELSTGKKYLISNIARVKIDF